MVSKVPRMLSLPALSVAASQRTATCMSIGSWRTVQTNSPACNTHEPQAGGGSESRKWGRPGLLGKLLKVSLIPLEGFSLVAHAENFHRLEGGGLDRSEEHTSELQSRL